MKTNKNSLNTYKSKLENLRTVALYKIQSLTQQLNSNLHNLPPTVNFVQQLTKEEQKLLKYLQQQKQTMLYSILSNSYLIKPLLNAFQSIYLSTQQIAESFTIVIKYWNDLQKEINKKSFDGLQYASIIYRGKLQSLKHSISSILHCQKILQQILGEESLINIQKKEDKRYSEQVYDRKSYQLKHTTNSVGQTNNNKSNINMQLLQQMEEVLKQDQNDVEDSQKLVKIRIKQLMDELQTKQQVLQEMSKIYQEQLSVYQQNIQFLEKENDRLFQKLQSHYLEDALVVMDRQIQQIKRQKTKDQKIIQYLQRKVQQLYQRTSSSPISQIISTKRSQIPSHRQKYNHQPSVFPHHQNKYTMNKVIFNNNQYHHFKRFLQKKQQNQEAYHHIIQAYKSKK